VAVLAFTAEKTLVQQGYLAIDRLQRPDQGSCYCAILYAQQCFQWRPKRTAYIALSACQPASRIETLWHSARSKDCGKGTRKAYCARMSQTVMHRRNSPQKTRRRKIQRMQTKKKEEVWTETKRQTERMTIRAQTDHELHYHNS
jgi:hypothetical protein